MTLITNADDIPELCFLKAYDAGKSADNSSCCTEACESDDEGLVFMTHEELAECLLNKSGTVPLPARFRALFALRNLADEEAIDIIGQCFGDKSALLKHELAYVLGQIGNTHALPILNSVLSDCSQDPMVRHEAGEALGAIGSLQSIPILKKYIGAEEHVAVRETCEIAVDNILKNHNATPEDKIQLAKDAQGGLLFGSMDPAPPAKVVLPTSELRAHLLDSTLPLYDRYKAMFALRNQGTEAAVLALCDGLQDSSALFRHEIGYVLGQLKHSASIPALAANLAIADEAPMVRHECAEALGSIATDECFSILEKYINDPVDVVRESCLVALDICEYENNDKQFMFLEKPEN